MRVSSDSENVPCSLSGSRAGDLGATRFAGSAPVQVGTCFQPHTAYDLYSPSQINHPGNAIVLSYVNIYLRLNFSYQTGSPAVWARSGQERQHRPRYLVQTPI